MSSGGGRLRLASAAGMVHAETGSGRMDLGRVSGGVRAETGAGRQSPWRSPPTRNFVDSELESPAGDVIVYLSPQLGAVIRASIDAASGQHHYLRLPGNPRYDGGSDWAKSVWAEAVSTAAVRY